MGGQNYAWIGFKCPILMEDFFKTTKQIFHASKLALRCNGYVYDVDCQYFYI